MKKIEVIIKPFKLEIEDDQVKRRIEVIIAKTGKIDEGKCLYLKLNALSIFVPLKRVTKGCIKRTTYCGCSYNKLNREYKKQYHISTLKF